MTDASSTVRLELDSRPESPALIRAALTGVAERLRFGGELSDDLRIAVTEACNNVVLHAYDGKPGPLVMDLVILPARVEVMVRDWGGGIKRLGGQLDDERMGVGLAVMSALADRAEFISAPDGGTEVRMTFSDPGLEIPPREHPADTAASAGAPVRLSGDVVATLSPVGLLGGVLGRVASALAARTHFSVDGLSDVRLVTDAIASFAKAAAIDAITFGVVARRRRLEMTVGPVRRGSGAWLQGDGHAAGLFDRPGSPLALLARELSMVPVNGFELLRVVVGDRGFPSDEQPR